MRRLVVVISLLAVAVFGALAASWTKKEDGGYPVAAVFDRANGIVPGNQVKVAGVVAGRVTSVDLAPGPKARIAMDLEGRFEPFHSDATCTILPEGLLSENFVSCDPGSPGDPPLAGPASTPTVTLGRTTVPTSLQDLLDVFSAPTSERVRLLINELGLATMARGEDINALLRRSNPALAQARELLGILNSQRRELSVGVGQMNRALRDVAAVDIRDFVGDLASVSRATAAKSGSLSDAVERFPPLLAAAQPALRSLGKAMSKGTPLLKTIDRAAPRVDDITRKVPAFADGGLHALNDVEAISRSGRAALPALEPVAHHLRSVSQRLRPAADDLDRFLINLRDSGAVEGLLTTLYAIATAIGPYDDVSHFVAISVAVFPQCLLDPNNRGCRSTYSSPGNGTIPPDDPSCGPQSGAIWDPPTDCRSKVPVGITSKPDNGEKDKGIRLDAKKPEPRADRPEKSTESSSRTPEPQRSPDANAGAEVLKAPVKSLLNFLLGKR